MRFVSKCWEEKLKKNQVSTQVKKIFKRIKYGKKKVFVHNQVVFSTTVTTKQEVSDMTAVENLYILDGNDFSLCEKRILYYFLSENSH